MTAFLTLLDLGGSIALLLWGLHMVQTGVQRAFGARLRTVLSHALRRRPAAFLAGLAVTAVLQSSTATGLMATGFVADGVVGLVPALAVMLGANVGTTLIVQALSFDVAAAAPVLVLAGLLLFRRAAAGPRDFGRVLIGLGLMLMALRQLLDLSAPIADAPQLRLLLGMVAAEPVLDVALAAVLTWAAHSSVAVVLLVMSLAAKGAVPPAAAFALVLGANLGSAVNPVLEGAPGTDPAARRLPLGNLLCRALGVAAALAALPVLARWAAGTDPARAVAGFHVAFNLALAALFLPVLPAYAALLRRLLPARADPADPARPMYLDPAARAAPAVALGAAAREALRLADVLEEMIQGVRDAFGQGGRRRIAEARRLAEVLGRLNAALRAYLAALDPEAMTEADARRAADVLAFALNLEHAGSVVERNLLGPAARALKRGVLPGAAQRAGLVRAVDRLLANLRAAASLLVTADVRTARLLAAEKEGFRAIEARAAAAHLALVRDGTAAEADAALLYLEAVRDLKRVNAHLVAAAAYPVLEGRGELLPSRLRGPED